MPKLKRLDPVWYRLKVRAPFIVDFSRSAWRVIEPVPIPGYPNNWALEAESMNGEGRWVLSESYHTREWLEQALYVDGFASRHQTAMETILNRAVALGKAERVDTQPPNVAPYRGWPWSWP